MRYRNTIYLKKRRILRIKKAMAVAIAFLLVFGITIADRGCGMITGQKDRIIPKIVLIGDGVVKLESFMGDVVINLSHIKD